MKNETTDDRKQTVGFVILTWNSERVIAACLDSIVTLTVVDPYVVIVDNGSTDGTAQIIDSYIRNNPEHFKLIHFSENKGTTISRNTALRLLMEIKPNYYCVLDSDTQINDNAFQTMIGELKLHPEYGMIGPEMKTSSGLVQMSARAFPTLLEKIYKAVPSKSLQRKGEEMEIQVAPCKDAVSYSVDYLMSACWLLRPEVLKCAGLLDEKIFYAPEDAEYCIRIWKTGFCVAFCPKAQIIHEWQRLSKKKFISKMNWVHICGLAYMFRKHHYLLSTKNLKKQFKKIQLEVIQ